MASRTSAYKVRIRTDSADTNALMLVDAGELVAILVELADECHGDHRGQWIIETTFGLNTCRGPGFFACAADAANWIGHHVCKRSFVLDQDLIQLS